MHEYADKNITNTWALCSLMFERFPTYFCFWAVP